MRIDGDGEPLWQRLYSGEGHEIVVDAAKTIDGGIEILGRSISASEDKNGEYFTLILKLDSSGRPRFERAEESSMGGPVELDDRDYENPPVATEAVSQDTNAVPEDPEGPMVTPISFESDTLF